MKKIPWWLPQIGTPKERALITQALDNNFINEGPLVNEFEKRIADLVGARFGIATTSCTVGMTVALMALGVKAGDEVIVPDVTFIATANAVSLTGAKPVLVDIDPKTLTISLEAIKNAITAKTKAIVPVHVTGRAADMENILKIAKEHNLPVVEDAAEALLSKHRGKFLGTFGAFGCFSFSPNKTITTGQGGMIVTNDEKLCDLAHRLKDQGRPVRGTGGDDLHDTVGYNFRPTDLQAAVGLGQLDFIEQRAKRMRRNYEIYATELANVAQLKLYPTTEEELPQWTDGKFERRDDLVKFLWERGMDSRKYWFPLHQQKAYWQSDENFPYSTKNLPQSLWLPSAFTLTDEDIQAVCNAIKEFYA